MAFISRTSFLRLVCEIQSPQIPHFTTVISLMTDHLLGDDQRRDPSVKRQSQEPGMQHHCLLFIAHVYSTPRLVQRVSCTFVLRTISLPFASCYIAICS